MDGTEWIGGTYVIAFGTIALISTFVSVVTNVLAATGRQVCHSSLLSFYYYNTTRTMTCNGLNRGN
jgi:hypothetical protein